MSTNDTKLLLFCNSDLEWAPKGMSVNFKAIPQRLVKGDWDKSYTAAPSEFLSQGFVYLLPWHHNTVQSPTFDLFIDLLGSPG